MCSFMFRSAIHTKITREIFMVFCTFCGQQMHFPYIGISHKYLCINCEVKTIQSKLITIRRREIDERIHLCSLSNRSNLHRPSSILHSTDWNWNVSLIFASCGGKQPTAFVNRRRKKNLLNYNATSRLIIRFVFHALLCLIFFSVYKFNYRCHHSTWLETLSLTLSLPCASSSSFKCKCYVTRHAVSLLLFLVPKFAAKYKRISFHMRRHTKCYYVLSKLSFSLERWIVWRRRRRR